MRRHGLVSSDNTGVVATVVNVASAPLSLIPVAAAKATDDYDDDYDPDEFVSTASADNIKVRRQADKPKAEETTKKEKKRSSINPPYYQSMKLSDPKTWIGEAAAMVLLVVYAFNFVIGRRENLKIASEWHEALSPTFRSQFSKLCAFEKTEEQKRQEKEEDEEDDDSENESDDEEEDKDQDDVKGVLEGEELLRDSVSAFKFYASGRRNCSGVLATLELKKRHDLFSSVLSFFDLAPKHDTVTIEISIPEDKMPPIVFLVCRKRLESEMRNDMEDVKSFASVVNSAKVPKELSLLTDCPSLVGDLLSQKVLKALKDSGDLFQAMHFTDQNREPHYGGPGVIRFRYKLPSGGDYKALIRLTEMAIYYVDRVAGLKLSSAAHTKAKKLREAVEKTQKRLTHAERQEAFARRKEEARQNMNEEDLKELKAREEGKRLKKRQPRFKVVK